MSITRELMKLYPNPVSARDGGGKQYCVGGALCRYQTGEQDYGFPAVGDLRKVLQHANPRLDWREAKTYATSIIAANDSSEFDQAMDILAEALGEPGEAQKVREERLEALCNTTLRKAEVAFEVALEQVEVVV